MTRQFNQKSHCPNCQTWHTSETLFGRWLRNREDLDSQNGTCVLDSDYWVHRYKTYNPTNGRPSREIQCIMLVEVKTNGCDLSAAQRDTLGLVNQILRNRKDTPTKTALHQAGSSVVKVRSLISQSVATVWCYGAHLLRFSGLGVEDSNKITWDNRHTITPDQLAGLLRFDTNPDTMRPIDFRIHHSHQIQPTLNLKT